MMDIDIDLPQEPLPIDTAHDEDPWEDEEDDPTNDIFQNYFDELNTCSIRNGSQRTAQDYRLRINNEHINWKAQEDFLTTAYIEWRAKGRDLKVEGEEMDWFHCELWSIHGEPFYSTLCAVRLIHPQVSIPVRSITRRENMPPLPWSGLDIPLHPLYSHLWLLILTYWSSIVF